ncbi:MAG: hypothetical protein RLZZ494_832 [Pseudomonadota bacterium]|jgi:two-component system sensor histidine kinase CreC
MKLGWRLLLAFALVIGAAAFAVARVFVAGITPNVREVMEDGLVDTAHLLAEVATSDLAAMPAGGTLDGSALAHSIQAYRARSVNAPIWGVAKQSLDLRVYVTDRQGRVVFDSAEPSAVGQDYSRWRDVARTLSGQYGARATLQRPEDDRSSVLYVAAPVRHQGELLGVLTVAKPESTVAEFVQRTENKMLWTGVGLLTLISAVGAVVTWRTVREVRRLRHYAQCVGDPACDASASLRPPALPGELGELARALERMRQRLAGRRQLERDVQGLKQQLQTPLKALADAARGLPEHPTRQAIVTQVEQLRQLTERLLALARLESQAGLTQPTPIDLLALSEQVLAGYFARLQQRHVQVVWQAREAVQVPGDAAMLSMALSNLLLNAYQYAPAGSTLELGVSRQGPEAVWCVRDHGPGVSADVLPQLGQRFFALPNPLDDRQGNGLGLALVAQVAALHGGRWQAEPAAPGLRVRLILPRLNPSA